MYAFSIASRLGLHMPLGISMSHRIRQSYTLQAFKQTLPSSVGCSSPSMGYSLAYLHTELAKGIDIQNMANNAELTVDYISNLGVNENI